MHFKIRGRVGQIQFQLKFSAQQQCLFLIALWKAKTFLLCHTGTSFVWKRMPQAKKKYFLVSKRMPTCQFLQHEDLALHNRTVTPVVPVIHRPPNTLHSSLMKFSMS